jgi:hypothetical protein
MKRCCSYLFNRILGQFCVTLNGSHYYMTVNFTLLYMTILIMAIPWRRQLVASLSQQMPLSVHVGFVWSSGTGTGFFLSSLVFSR